MNLRKRTRLTAEVSTSSMNDIMFFLLLFFLIASTMVSPNVIKLLLPNAKNTTVPVIKKTVSVEVSDKLEIYVNKRLTTLGNVESELKAAFAGITEPTVMLKMDKSLTVQNLADLLDIGNKLKVRMVLATQTSKE